MAVAAADGCQRRAVVLFTITPADNAWDVLREYFLQAGHSVFICASRIVFIAAMPLLITGKPDLSWLAETGGKTIQTLAVSEMALFLLVAAQFCGVRIR